MTRFTSYKKEYKKAQPIFFLNNYHNLKHLFTRNHREIIDNIGKFEIIQKSYNLTFMI